MLFSFYVRSSFLSIYVKIHPKSHILEARCRDGERKSVQHVQTVITWSNF